jgi:meso-butanediol dehydrogenase/(S,S)-butanediol dehydrogenase/diacetyl reductase
MASANKPVVLITGASAGIGEGIAHRFAKGGWNIVAVARRKEKLEKLKKELAGQAEVEVVAIDVTSPEASQVAVAAAMKAFGRLDCLVNNAGIFKFGAVHEVDDAALDEAIDVSLKAPFRFSRAALGVMKPGSSIVSIGSVWGIVAGAGGGTYCALKAALIGLTQSLAIDYGAKGIRANLVAPSVVRTDMTDGFWDTEGFQRTNQEMTPITRDATVDDVAHAVFFLASAEAGFVNGQTLALDGGWSTTKFLSLEALMAQRVKA